MNIIACDDLMSVLDKNDDVEFISPKPICPKNNDAMCLAIVDNCASGNKRNCEQWLEFYYQSRSIYRLKVMFKISPGENNGYVRFTDMQVRKMLEKGIIRQEDLQTVELA